MLIKKNLLMIGALLGGLAVILGAFGAHGLKSVLSAAQLVTFETAVRYQMYHALAILVLPSLLSVASVKWLNRAAIAFLIGIFLFSGSLYMLVMTGIKLFGPITPLGGVGFIIGWLCVAMSIKVGNSDE